MNKGIYSRMVNDLQAEQQLLHTQQITEDCIIEEVRANLASDDETEKIEDEVVIEDKVVVDEIKNDVEVSTEANISTEANLSSYIISINKRRERMNKRANEVDASANEVDASASEVDASASEAEVDASANEAEVDASANEAAPAEEPEEAPEAVPEAKPKKRSYRDYIFDNHDTDYANTLKRCFTSNDEITRQYFNEVTDNLMADKQISRNGLLDAIDDYKRSGYNVFYPLHRVFTDNAFNYRPWQPGCVIS